MNLTKTLICCVGLIASNMAMAGFECSNDDGVKVTVRENFSGCSVSLETDAKHPAGEMSLSTHGIFEERLCELIENNAAQSTYEAQVSEPPQHKVVGERIVSEPGKNPSMIQFSVEREVGPDGKQTGTIIFFGNIEKAMSGEQPDGEPSLNGSELSCILTPDIG